MKKTVLAAVFAAVFALALCTCALAAAFVDVEGGEYYAEAAEFLAAKGILKGYADGTFGAGAGITRAEMAAVICRMIGKESESEKAAGETAFDDVGADDWASGYINIASREKIINGDGDGKFRPEDDVLYEEAVKMVVCALGLGDGIEVDPADWSAGYIAAADKNGITEGLKGKKGEPSTRGDVAVMVYGGLVGADKAFLKTAEYLDFELTGTGEPYFAGRWFEKEIDGEKHMVTLNDGALFFFMIKGAESFELDYTVITTGKTPFFAYSIDGEKPVRQHITEPTVKLPDTGRHTVRIIADGMTEGEGKWDKEKGFALRSVTPSEGGEILGIRPTNKVIFYYGDSITEGIRALNMNADSDGNSATNSYPWYCSAKLRAVTYSVGYGATGVIRTGSFNTFINAIDRLSEAREVPDTDRPDLIVVNHGTNDASMPGDQFKTELEKALTRLQEKYPGVPVAYLIPFNQSMAQAIRDVAGKFEGVTVVETRDWALTYTDGTHPNEAGAQKAGEKLADALKDLLTPEAARTPDGIDAAGRN